MSRVYVTSDARAEPGADAVLGRLGDAGHEVVIVAADGVAADGSAVAASAAPDAPSIHSGRPAWLITADPRTCGRRTPALRTILIGPRRPTARGPVARCDLEARDLSAAVLEILTREAME